MIATSSYIGTVQYVATLTATIPPFVIRGEPMTFYHLSGGTIGTLVADGTVVTGTLGTATLQAAVEMTASIQAFDFQASFPGATIAAASIVAGTVYGGTVLGASVATLEGIVVISSGGALPRMGTETLTGTVSAQADPTDNATIWVTAVSTGLIVATLPTTISGGVMAPVQFTGAAGDYTAVGTVQADSSFAAEPSNVFPFTLTPSARTFTIGGSQTA